MEQKEERETMTKEQQIFTRIVGLFFILYGFLMLSQPLQYGLGMTENVARLAGIILAIIGIYVAIRK